VTHQPGPCGLFHDPEQDCTDVYLSLTPAELTVVDLLGFHRGHGHAVRLTPSQRATVTRVTAWALTMHGTVPVRSASGEGLARRRTDRDAS